MKTLTCRICTIKLVEAAYSRAGWFRLVREPLRLGLRLLEQVYGIDTKVYELHNPACNGCLRQTKLELKAHSALFRLLNKFINPYFDRLIERLVEEQEQRAARDFAQQAVSPVTRLGGSGKV